MMQYGDCFTFILFGRRVTVCLGKSGNELILNGRPTELSAEEVYAPLTTPVFGEGVVYDCSNARFMEQKKVNKTLSSKYDRLTSEILKYGLTTSCFRNYVPLIVEEFRQFQRQSPHMQGDAGICNITQLMAELTMFSASRCLQGIEVRQKLDPSFANLYHDLNAGFSPINFLFPKFPSPMNWRRDQAREKLTQLYLDIISARMEDGNNTEQDIIWHLMHCKYKDGTRPKPKEIAHMMIALHMAGQHSSAMTCSWVMIRLGQNPDVLAQLYEEQARILGDDLGAISLEDIERLTLHSCVIRETLRLHAPIHSIMRKAKVQVSIPDSDIHVPSGHILLSAPGTMSRDAQYFERPQTWCPERWMVAGRNTSGLPLKDSISTGPASPYLPFGAGVHRCIGEQFAIGQIKMLIALLVRDYKWTSRGEKHSCLKTDYSVYILVAGTCIANIIVVSIVQASRNNRIVVAEEGFSSMKKCLYFLYALKIYQYLHTNFAL